MGDIIYGWSLTNNSADVEKLSEKYMVFWCPENPFVIFQKLLKYIMMNLEFFFAESLYVM